MCLDYKIQIQSGIFWSIWRACEKSGGWKKNFLYTISGWASI